MGEALMSGGAGGSGTIYKWKRYELNSSTRYTWNQWNLNSQTVYKWNRYNTTGSGYVDSSDGSSSVSLFGYTTVKGYTFNTSSGTYTLSGQFISSDGNDSSALHGIDNTIGSSGINGKTYSKVGDTGSSIFTITKFNGWSGYYAQYSTTIRRAKSAISQGSTYYGQVTSTSSSAYPSNGASGSYWYVSAGSGTEYSRGSYVGTVSSSSSSAYPNGSWSGSYWYDGRSGGTTYSQGAAAGTVYNTNRDAYPDNSYTGSYWYVFDGEA